MSLAVGEKTARSHPDRGAEPHPGFPLALNLPGGEAVVHLPAPPLLPNFDPAMVGIASLDADGRVRRLWGLAERAPLLQREGLREGLLGPLVEAALAGECGALYHEGYRYCGGGGDDGPFLLVVNAQEERQVRRRADRSTRMANALRRFGKALTMNPTVRPLCTAAAHEIASSTELAATLIWTCAPEGHTLDLVASVGVNRQGTHTLAQLSLRTPGRSAAELAAASQEPFFLEDVLEHMLTQNLESRFCYLRPGSLAILPLVISGRLLGVLELVGRQGDPNFEENRELFQTLAEHLALALNSAQMFENFERLASHDPLTGIANHRAMQEFLHRRLAESDRSGQPVGVVMVDVDHFRAFNEEEGHDVGDEVLRRVAQAIKLCLRPYDLAARYGGEEFTVIVPGGNAESVVAAAARIRQAVEAIEITTAQGRRRHVTVSLGCATYPANAADAPSVLRAADVALYRAKRAGRNRSSLFEGAFAGEEREAGVPLATLDAWLSESQRAVAEDRVRRFASVIDRIAFALGISAAQRSILEAMAYGMDIHAAAALDPELRARLERAEEFRVLLPNLDAMPSRYDEAGDRIPLLARILAVIACRDGGEDPESDPGRFDPEVVALTRSVRQAA
ncbi:MAG: diguanylate cyclase [Fimbriimonas sp.]